MGLLDDAIREHLELRRRAGADASEVANLEQEALGPVVRGAIQPANVGTSPAEPGDPNDQLAIEDQPVPEQAAQAAAVHPEDPADTPQSGHEHDVLPAADQDPALYDEALGVEEPPLGHTLAPEAPLAEPPSEHEPHVPPAALGQPTEEYDVAAVHGEAHGEAGSVSEGQQSAASDAAESPEVQPGDVQQPPASEPTEKGPEHQGEEAEGEDVLEQTPEFLQETPEHDRLWFEQAPPKDFDFDR